MRAWTESRRATVTSLSPFIVIAVVVLALLALSAIVGGCASSHRVESHNGFPVVGRVQCVPGPMVIEDSEDESEVCK